MTRFYKIYLTVIIVFLFALAVFLFHLDWWIADYNETLPETISKSYFNWIFSDDDSPNFHGSFSISINEFEADWGSREQAARETASEHVKKAIGDSPSYEVTFNHGDVIGYSVNSNGREIATFTLTKNERGLWQAGNLSVHIDIPKQDLTVKALSSSTVYVNGTQVSTDYIVGTEPHFSEGYLPEGVADEKYITYHIKGFINTPEVIIHDRNKNTPTLSEIDGMLVENVIYDVPSNEISARMLDAAINIELHKRHIVPLSMVTPYIEEYTHLYGEIEKRDAKAINKKYEIREVKLLEYFAYNDKTLSIRTVFTLVTDKEELIDVTYFARKIDGEYFIYKCKKEL